MHKDLTTWKVEVNISFAQGRAYPKALRREGAWPKWGSKQEIRNLKAQWAKERKLAQDEGGDVCRSRTPSKILPLIFQTTVGHWTCWTCRRMAALWRRDGGQQTLRSFLQWATWEMMVAWCTVWQRRWAESRLYDRMDEEGGRWGHVSTFPACTVGWMIMLLSRQGKQRNRIKECEFTV